MDAVRGRWVGTVVMERWKGGRVAWIRGIDGSKNEFKPAARKRLCAYTSIVAG